MPDDMVERVARAISLQLWKNGLGMTGADVLARVAIEAMREPTDRMVEVGNDAQSDKIGSYVQQVAMESYVPWRAMIDAALGVKSDA